MPAAAAFATLIGGLIISMFEPRFVLGSFWVTVAWWVAAGIGMAEAKPNPDASDGDAPIT